MAYISYYPLSIEQKIGSNGKVYPQCLTKKKGGSNGKAYPQSCIYFNSKKVLKQAHLVFEKTLSVLAWQVIIGKNKLGHSSHFSTPTHNLIQRPHTVEHNKRALNYNHKDNSH